MKQRSIFLMILVVLFITACTPQSSAVTTPETPVGMPNPASQYCEDQGGELEIRDEEEGQVGYCIFRDGSECEEWAFFRGECAPAGQEVGGMPNPASQNCANEGGEVVIQQRGDGAEYGLCIFEDNRQCEEWALLRGDCPVGGIKVTGYITQAAQYCAVTGGQYTITALSGQLDEKGTCTFANGKICDAWEYFNGECDSQSPDDDDDQGDVGMPNPASQYCADQGGELEIRDEADGQAGYCIFPDGSECEEWAFFRGECAPASAEEEEKITARMLVEPGALVGPGPSYLNWSPQGSTLAYVAHKDGQDLLWLYEAATHKKRILLDPSDHDGAVDISPAQWSPQGDSLLLRGDEALWLLDVETGDLTPLAEGGAKTAVAFSPTGEMVSYAQDNDLFTVRIAGGEIQQLTSDGGETVSNGTHYNGTLDWVYTEEFATRVAQPAYAWSPDGEWLIYLRLDDEGVQQHPYTDFRTIPPTVNTIRYPTAGSPNPEVSLHLIGFEEGKPTEPFTLPEDAEYILPVLSWDPGTGEALYLAENREHTELRLQAWDPETNTGRTVITETAPDWINEHLYVMPVFLGDEDGRFLWLSERDGFMHIYLYSREGELIKQLTEGDWFVDSLPWDLLTPSKPVHLDPSGTWAYFSTTQVSPLERHLYRLNIETGEMEQLSQEAGFHFAALSGDGQFLVGQFSSVDTTPLVLVLHADGGLKHVLGRSAGPALDLPEVSREFLTVEAHDGEELYAQIVKPQDFDPQQKYPVVIHWYGGPTLQLVSNRYGTDNIFNHIERDVIYTQEGFIVWRLDNRGSFGRGHAFEAPIHEHMGPAALDDQLAGVEYLKTLPYVDGERIGVDGKSFGGFLTLYALIHEPETFAAGVAGSGPTDWRTYDTVYTERYMGTPQQNPDGYEATELVSRVDQLQIRPLIIHGLADTNVHLQNSVNLMDAMMKIDKPFDFLPLPNSDHHYGGDGLVYVLAEGARYFTQYLQPVSGPPASTEAPTDTAGQEPAASSSGYSSAADSTASEVTTSVSDDWVPLKDALDSLEPKQVWQNFYDLTQLPRPSHHEQKVSDFLAQFGQDLGLETIQDDVGNVIIRKPASPGMENRQGVILQAHMDMVPQKSEDKDHDFLTDPIEAYVAGEWVTADSTTLGADDGIGVATAMAILQSDTLEAGLVEALFTVDEEDGFDGVNGLESDVLQGDILINLDWETEGSYCIGSAGGEAGDIKTTYDEVSVPADMAAYELQVQGLKGGHSGLDIDKGRGNATKLLVRLLKTAAQENQIRLASIEGGSARNAIPQTASAIVTVPESQSSEFLDAVQKFEGIVKNELSAVEPDLTVQATPTDLPAKVMDEDFQRTLIEALYGTPQGVMRMSDAVPGLVETSTNMGIVQAKEGELAVTHYLRSSVDSSLDDVDQMIASVWGLAGIDVDFGGRYPGWKPDPDEPILGLMKDVYKDLYSQEAGVEAVHAGLECSVIGEKYPNLEIISIGPTLLDVHTPGEKLQIATVQKLTDLLQETLSQIPEK